MATPTLVIPRLTRYIPHPPHPKQAIFLSITALEAFYGGSAGGGKSDALLMAALQYVDKPGYAALILRKTFAELALPGAIMDRSKEWLARTDAKWNEQDKTWRFPSGAKITFGFLETVNDRYRYQGSEYQFIGFDELTHFVESDYVYLFSRMRRTQAKASIPLRMRGAGNPGGIGHQWVNKRFIRESSREDRIFIPAGLRDNPALDREEYEEALSNLDEITRRQLLDGDWTARTLTGREYFDPIAVRARLEEVRGVPFRQGYVEGDPVIGGSYKFTQAPEGRLRIFEAPRKHGYAIFVDPAGGITDDQYEAMDEVDREGDPVAIQVMSLRDGRQVAEHEEIVEEDEAARIAATLGLLYRDSEDRPALIAVEQQGGYGKQALHVLARDLRYPMSKIYHREILDDETRKRTSKLGFETTQSTRPLMLGEMRTALKGDPEAFRSERLLEQMLDFVWSKSGKPAARIGSHDDLVMGFAGVRRVMIERAGGFQGSRQVRPRTAKKASIAQRAPRF